LIDKSIARKKGKYTKINMYIWKSTHISCSEKIWEDPKMEKMSLQSFFLAGAVVCVLLVIAGRKKMEWLLNFLLRGILGTVAIYFVNMGLDQVGISLSVGINPITVLTSTILGFPGVLALYGIGIYRML